MQKILFYTILASVISSGTLAREWWGDSPNWRWWHAWPTAHWTPPTYRRPNAVQPNYQFSYTKEHLGSPHIIAAPVYREKVIISSQRVPTSLGNTAKLETTLPDERWNIEWKQHNSYSLFER